MMEGALSGKTGFTGDAGYCYVGSLRQGERTFIVALLACGWPNNKSYKWADTKKLMNYGLENYEYREIWQETDPGNILVKNGADNEEPFKTEIAVPLETVGEEKELRMLLRKDEQIDIALHKEEILTAPVSKGQKVGEVTYMLNGEKIRAYDVVTTSGVYEKTFSWYFKTIFDLYFMEPPKPLSPGKTTA